MTALTWNIDECSSPDEACCRLRGGLRRALALVALWPLVAGAAEAAPGMFVEALPIVENDNLNGELGFSVAPAGDVNGDGYGDLVAGSPFYEYEQIGGRITVYFGGPDGLDEGNVVHRTADQGTARLGWSVAGVGDVNGDGFDDVAAGAPFYDDGESNEGGVFLYYGRADGQLDGPDIFQMNDAGARFGWTVSWVGDTNGDGYDEVLAGAPEWGGFGSPFYIPVQGAARMYYGEAGTPSTYWSIPGGQEDMDFGFAAAGVGDVNGDGYNDVVVGGPLYDAGVLATEHGIARCYLGGPDGLATTEAWSVVGSGVEDHVGERAGRAGDVNGDGYADFLLGSPYRTRSFYREGGFELYHGGPGGPSATPAYAEDGGDEQDRLGWVVTTAGDINGDGYADFMTREIEPAVQKVVRTFLGGPGGITEQFTIANSSISRWAESAAAADLNGDGRNELYIGGPDLNELAGGIWRFYARHANPTPNYASAPHWVRYGQNANDGYGVGLAAGDLNGDGYDELVVGSPGADDEASDGGRIEVFLGSASGLVDGSSPAWSYAGTTDFERVGASVDIAGDVNGDGYSDLIVGTGAERVLVFHGDPSATLSATPDWTYDFPDGPALFGYDVAGVGDVNADGYADVMAGAPLYTDTVVNEGLALLFFGSAAGVQSSGHVSLSIGASLDARFGQSMDGAGDVNGDGYEDVIVGAPGEGASGDGKAYVYLGSATGPVEPATWSEVGGGNGGASFGWCVAGVGDVNGDGFSDVAVGAPNYVTGSSQPGRVRVFKGAPTGIDGLWYDKVGPQSMGEAVAGAGDYDQDGLSDVLVSAPTYQIGGLILLIQRENGFPDDTWNSGEFDAAGYSLVAGDFDGDRIPELVGGSRQDAAVPGVVVVFQANADGNAHGPWLSRQLTSTDLPVAEGGLSAETDLARLAAKGWSAAGRTQLRLECQIAPIGSPYAPASTTPWEGTGAPGSPPLELTTEESLSPDTAYRWRVRVGSKDPAFLHSPWLSMPISVATEKQLRTSPIVVAASGADAPHAGDRLLAPVHPNPASGACVVSFSLERDTSVRVDVLDVSGRRVVTLLDGDVAPGRRTVVWDGRDTRGVDVASGVYFVRLRAGERGSSTKVQIRR